MGSNVGDRKGYIKKALELLHRSPGVRVRRVASLYLTAPVGCKEQEWFLNTVAEAETGLEPRELLEFLLETEKKLGRVRTKRWGPRTADLDLLLCGEQRIAQPGLVVPHPRMGERAFVMVPLAELEPGLMIPGVGKAAEVAALLAVEQSVKKVGRIRFD
jgi:2-amino-4-hydroxy-6-hydroxymethyldihydropteridine diphosphokinase